VLLTEKSYELKPMDTSRFTEKYQVWDFYTAAARSLESFRDWAARSGIDLHVPLGGRMEHVRFENHGGRPHLVVDITVAIPLLMAIGKTPVEGSSKSPRSSASTNRDKTSPKRPTAVAADVSDIPPAEQSPAVS
jgi:hypothetical protein